MTPTILTEADSKLVETFETRLRKLMDLYQMVKAENSSLREELEQSRLTTRELQDRVKMLEDSYSNLKQTKVLEVSGRDIDLTKQRIGRLITEIDQCINLLNME